MAKSPPIPEAALEHHIAALGKTGSGKTSTAKLIVEHVVAAGDRVCVLDPIKSDWWGLTSSADGRKAGLPFQILGGPYGHVPIHASAGASIAKLVARGNLRHSIIDMQGFGPGGLQQFFVDFAPTLMNEMRGIVYLVLEEAHLFAPKERSGIGAETHAIHWAKVLATAGRVKGIRLIVITQRTQALHNALLGSCDTILAHRLIAPADQEPVLKWLSANVDKKTAAEVASSLATLRKGEAWICSGEAQLFERRQFPPITTYDNTATPTRDASKPDVKTAPVDVEKLRTIIGEAVAEADANDPAKLKARIKELEGQLKATTAVPAEGLAERDRRIVELERRCDQLEREREDVQLLAITLVGEAEGLLEQLAQVLDTEGATIPETARSIPETPPATPKRGQNIPRSIPASRDARTWDNPKREALQPRERKLIDAIAWWMQVGVDAPTRSQVAFVAGYSPSSSSFQKSMGMLINQLQLMSAHSAGRVALTPAGQEVASWPTKAPSRHVYHERIEKLLAPREVKILLPLATASGRGPELTREDLAERSGYSASSSSFQKTVGRLVTLGLIEATSPGMVRGSSLLNPEQLS